MSCIMWASLVMQIANPNSEPQKPQKLLRLHAADLILAYYHCQGHIIWGSGTRTRIWCSCPGPTLCVCTPGFKSCNIGASCWAASAISISYGHTAGFRGGRWYSYNTNKLLDQKICPHLHGEELYFYILTSLQYLFIIMKILNPK